MHLRWAGFVFPLFVAWPSDGRAAESASPTGPLWEIESLEPGEFDYNLDDGRVILNDRFRITFEDQGERAFVIADQGRLDQSTGEIFAEGNVTLQNRDRVFTAERLVYNFQTRAIQTDHFRAGQAPFFVEGTKIRGDAITGRYSTDDAWLTTDDHADPVLRLRTRHLSLVPGKYIEARGATLYAGKVPLFYFPYYRRRLDHPPSQWSLNPGYRSRYGLFFEGAYDWRLSDRLGGEAHLDYRTRRGWATGLNTRYDLGQTGSGETSIYLLDDRDPSAGSGRRSRAGDFTDRNSRHRLSLYHTVDIRPDFTAKLLLQQQSDAFVNRDFFEGDFRRNPQPSSHVEIAKHWRNFSVSLLAQPRIDDFYQAIERLPEIRVTGLRQRLGASPLFYESEISVGHFRFRPAATDLDLYEYEAFRADTHQQLLLPRTWLGWLNVTPHAGVRLTHYGATSGGDPALGQAGGMDRAVFNTGVEVSFKASSTWANASSRLFDVDGLRHIVQPLVNYVYVPEPNKRPWELPQFDRELQTLRLRPIDFPDYNSIDSIDSRHIIRLGVRNRLQTKRNGQVDDLLNWELFTDWRLERNAGEVHFSDVYSDLELKPSLWLLLGSEARFDPNDSRLNEANHTLSLLPSDRWSWTLGHRYLRDLSPGELRERFPYDPFFRQQIDADWRWGNDLLFSRVYYRLNEEWGFRMIHQFEASDGTMEEQSYSVYRDFSSATAALRFRLRDHRSGKNDFSVNLVFSLKAMPSVDVGDDSNRLETRLFR
ncbi:MAG: LPS assembly protein LptD [Verrucomicrobiota bacterium]|nr:LPS assembly protein LptD [Verrucomicrobiota bacterium]